MQETGSTVSHNTRNDLHSQLSRLIISLGGRLVDNQTIVDYGLELLDGCWNTYIGTAYVASSRPFFSLFLDHPRLNFGEDIHFNFVFLLVIIASDLGYPYLMFTFNIRSIELLNSFRFMSSSELELAPNRSGTSLKKASSPGTPIPSPTKNENSSTLPDSTHVALTMFYVPRFWSQTSMRGEQRGMSSTSIARN